MELSIVVYDSSIAFYDRMFGWLGYPRFWKLDIGYRSTYYAPNVFLPHSYVDKAGQERVCGWGATNAGQQRVDCEGEKQGSSTDWRVACQCQPSRFVSGNDQEYQFQKENS